VRHGLVCELLFERGRAGGFGVPPEDERASLGLEGRFLGGERGSGSLLIGLP